MVVVVACHVNAAFVACSDFLDVVLEAFKRVDFALVDELTASHESRDAVALNKPFGYHTTCDLACLTNREYLANFGCASLLLGVFSVEHVSHGLFDLVDEFVDDRVLDDANIVMLGKALHAVVEFDIEPNNHGATRTGESDVVLGNMANTLANHIEFDLVALDGFERLNQCFGRTVHIGLDDDAEALLLLVFDRGEEVFNGSSTPFRILLLSAGCIMEFAHLYVLLGAALS